MKLGEFLLVLSRKLVVVYDLILLALAIGLVLLISAPFALKHAATVPQVETQETNSDYVFVLHSGDPQSKGSSVELTPERPITLRNGEHDKEVLLIVPTVAAARFQTADDITKAFEAGQLPGTIRFLGCKPHAVVPLWTSNQIEVRYRVQRAESGELEVVRTSWSPLWQWYAAAIFVTVAVVIGGVWIIRRLRYPRLATTK